MQRNSDSKGNLSFIRIMLIPVNTVFTSSRTEVEQSKRIMDAYEETVKRGLGAASLEGRMIDYATYEMAKEHYRLLKP